MKLIVCTLAALALTGGQAFAHAHLVKADPTAGSTLAQAPTHLRLRFNEAVRLAGTGAELVAPGGHAQVLTLSQDPKDVRAVVASLPASLPAGRYQVRWKALSPDAHHTQGDFSFTVGH